MAHYIDKSALVAEIEKRIQESLDVGGATRGVYLNERMKEDSYILSFLDTFEVKEVDLEKELIEWHKEHFKKDGTFIGKSGFYLTNNSQMDIAKYFFELGLQAQKNNIRHSMDEIPNYPCDILLVTDVDNMFLFKYMENGRPVDRETPYFHNIQNGKYWYYCNDIVNMH